MGRRADQTLFQRVNADGQKTHEKMINITSHQGNANQNYSEISSHTCQNGYYLRQQNSKCQQGCGEK